MRENNQTEPMRLLSCFTNETQGCCFFWVYFQNVFWKQIFVSENRLNVLNCFFFVLEVIVKFILIPH